MVSLKSKESKAVRAPKARDGHFLALAQRLAAFDAKWNSRPLCGLDEAGRGPLAGPVVAAAVILDPNEPMVGVYDSKKLIAQKREEAYDLIMVKALDVAVALKSPQDVDKYNPLVASLMAMAEAFAALKVKPALALIDGPQTIPLPCQVIATPKGDSLSLAIAAASIVAKVTRDRLMLEESQKYPQYGFERHFGYGTRAHMTALATYGPSPIHRLTYRGVRPKEPGLFDDF